MQKHWEKIIQQIEAKYGITTFADWAENNKFKLKRLQSDLELKIKKLIVKDIAIAKTFLPKSVISTYTDLSEDERTEILENYIAQGKLTNPKIQIRTLENNLKESELPYHDKMRNLFSMYVYEMLFEHSISYHENLDDEQKSLPKKRQQEGLSKKIEQFYNTYFWVYYFHYEEGEKNHKIGRAVLIIENKDEVTLKNVEDETATDFIGFLEMENNSQHLYLDLKTIQTKEKHLRITVFIGSGKVYPLLLGVYTNIYGNNSMVAGSIVLEKVNDISIIQKMKPTSHLISEAVKHGVDKNIVKFLKKREQNFIKTPSGILTKVKLEEWKKIKDSKK